VSTGLSILPIVNLWPPFGEGVTAAASTPKFPGAASTSHAGVGCTSVAAAGPGCVAASSGGPGGVGVSPREA